MQNEFPAKTITLNIGDEIFISHSGFGEMRRILATRALVLCGVY